MYSRQMPCYLVIALQPLDGIVNDASGMSLVMVCLSVDRSTTVISQQLMNL